MSTPTPDLPVELWYEILGYLPRSALHKMIGVNRILFELALNDLYEELRFICDDKEMVKIFKQLKYPNVSKRVRHLFIRPSFLPGMDEELEPASRSQKLAEMIDSVKEWMKHTSNPHTLGNDGTHDPSRRILELASKSIKSCPNLHDITLIVHDHSLTPLFVLFLHSLWSSDSIGPCLRKLTIDTTVVKLPHLLDPLVKRFQSLPNLEALDVNISLSRLAHTPEDWHYAIDALTKFFKIFGENITSFTFSSLLSIDVSPFFHSIPRLPKLRTFEFISVFNMDCFKRPENLTAFLSNHSKTLTMLVLKPRARSATLHTSDQTYSAWLNGRSQKLKSQKQEGLSELVLPALHTLDIGLRDSWDSRSNMGEGTTLSSILPNLTVVTPRLTSLTLLDVKLSSEHTLSLVEMLGAREGGSTVERLVLASQEIFPELFDRLSNSIPRLKYLAIDYNDYTSGKPKDSRSSSIGTLESFTAAMHARRYPNWRLRCLRLASRYHCGTHHPNHYIMKIVVQCLSSDVVLDSELRCDCIEFTNYYPKTFGSLGPD